MLYTAGLQECFDDELEFEYRSVVNTFSEWCWRNNVTNKGQHKEIAGGR